MLKLKELCLESAFGATAKNFFLIAKHYIVSVHRYAQKLFHLRDLG